MGATHGSSNSRPQESLMLMKSIVGAAVLVASISLASAADISGAGATFRIEFPFGR